MAPKKKTKEGNLQQENILEAVVIADSFNVRFYPVTAKRPRCLFPLANKPLLSYTLEFLARCGVKHIFVYCCHCAEQIKDYLAQSKWSKPSSPCQVTTIVSCDFTSVGDVLRDIDQKSLFESDFLLVPGDVVSNAQLKDALNEHKVRREKDRNIPLMTLVLHSSSPTHQSRTVESDIVIASNAVTNRVLHYHKIADNERKVQFPLGIFQSKEGRIEIRYDLSDTGIWVCSPQVPQLFTDNFDYQTQLDFIKGILINEEFLGNQIHMHVVQEHYCSRVYNFHTYDVVSHDVIFRWTYPFVPEIHFDDDYSMHHGANGSLSTIGYTSSYSLLRHNVYLHNTCLLGQNSIVQDNVVIGNGSKIGNRCYISNSVIGDGCCIEDDCIIENSYLWSNVTVKSKSKIHSSFVCDDVSIHEGVVLSAGCILCDKVLVGPSIELESKIIHKNGDDKTMGIVADKQSFDTSLVGENGEGYIWHKDVDVEADNDRALSKALWGLSLHDHNKQKLTADSSEESNSENDISSAGEESDFQEESEEDAFDDLSNFEKEVKESLQRGYEEKVQCDNLVLEVNSSKYAYNMSMRDVIQTIAKSLLEIAAAQSMDATSYFATLKEVLLHFLPLLCNYNKTASSQLDYLYALEEYAVSHVNFANSLIKVFMLLYEKDVLSEEVILHWNSKPGNYKDVITSQEIRRKVEKFIQWLVEAEEEDSDE
ncbi:translation initiation factor eIF2B subunit epsilon-like [Clavelina lepadiformis]|uniref:translation initiation factor eIF2B subunit epsilon-like n=1 Tax=Clavelina lepadiformis TaxID=159417 RepID=UPI00404287BF